MSMPTEPAQDSTPNEAESGSAPNPVESHTEPLVPSQDNSDSLASGFLKDIPEADRAVVERYVKDWDSGVTKKFQEIHSQYDPYKQLGADPDDLRAAYDIYQQLNTDPKAFHQALVEALGDELTEQASGTQQQNPAYQGLPEEFTNEFQQTRRAVEAMAQWIIDQQDTTRQAQEDAELENYLGQLKAAHGDFDEDYVLTQMYSKGVSGEDAIKAWQHSLQEYVNKSGGIQPKPGFKPLSGGGSVPSDSKGVTELTPKEVKSLVANILQQSNEGG